jgi:hypothetical protein
VRAIAAGTAHSCALTNAGAVKCWGLNADGELGNGTSYSTSVPVDVSGLSIGVIAIAAGAFHNCALQKDGGIECWGDGGAGQLGDDATVNRLKPAHVVGFGAVKAVLSVLSRSVAVTRARIAAVKLHCGSAARCDGRLSLFHQQMKLGSRTFSIAAGATRPVGVRISVRAFALLIRMKRLPARAAIVYRQPSGGTTATTGVITLRAA